VPSCNGALAKRARHDGQVARASRADKGQLTHAQPSDKLSANGRKTNFNIKKGVYKGCVNVGQRW
jgi:hypothetical protein